MHDWTCNPGGYRWWYYDAISADGQSAMVAIFFVGSVFSPHYAKRIRRGEDPSPFDHCAVNFALYRRGQRPWWVFSEYGAGRFEADANSIGVAGSHFERQPGGIVELVIEDTRVATRQRTSARIRMTPLEDAMTKGYVDLGRGHEWRAHAPRMHVEAKFYAPGLSFEGLGYHDENRGPEPLSRAFSSWSWGRLHAPGESRVFFDLVERGEREPEGARTHRYFKSGHAETKRHLPARVWSTRLSQWMIPMPVLFDAGVDAMGKPLRMVPDWELEQAPFYSRFVGHVDDGTQRVSGMGEHISFDRVNSRLVEKMISMRLARPDEQSYGWLS